ncbi:MAG: Gfo/Idh/MocA family oxidoreductase [Kiritimatiellaeota bacterium]|nr:Gfo/Idh/MocA family oxidoreductase [Kiritimatiellota bacterium]
MSTKQSRRSFLKTAAAGTGMLAATRVFGAPAILSTRSPGAQLRTAVIGCGGRGVSAHVAPAAAERLVALVDADEKGLAKALKKAGAKSGIRTFNDYRKLFDVMGKELDAVFIATPNFHHALPAMLAMQRGIGVYVEKPLTYTIAEARALAAAAKQFKVATQMGNQGHSGESYRRLCEYIWAGAIGNVTEVHHWCNRSNGGVGGRLPTLPVPAGMHWEEWIGPAPFRDYHKDLHPHEWHTWHDFGNGSLGNMACHIMDGAFWALKIEHPTSIEVEEMAGGSAERYPTGTRIRWDVPARGAMPPVKIYWWDGKRAGIKHAGTDAEDTPDSVSKNARNRPPLVEKLEKEYGRDFGGNGTFYIGDKGIMYTGCYGEGVRIIPEEKHKAFPMPAASIPRIKGSHQGDFLRACRGGPPACAAFDYSARLTEFAHLGCLAIKAGLGKKIEWDGTQCTNLPDINRLLARQNRPGWQA